jgi:hypothetical protein
MAIGNEVDNSPFADQGFRNNNGKSKALASSGCGMIQFDRPLYFNSSSTPLSGEKGKPEQLTKRNVTRLQPAPQQSVGALSCAWFTGVPRFLSPNRILKSSLRLNNYFADSMLT